MPTSEETVQTTDSAQTANARALYYQMQGEIAAAVSGMKRDLLAEIRELLGDTRSRQLDQQRKIEELATGVHTLQLVAAAAPLQAKLDQLRQFIVVGTSVLSFVISIAGIALAFWHR